jgi:hypothetical protein
LLVFSSLLFFYTHTHTNYYIDVLVVVEQTKSRLFVYIRVSRSDCGSSIPVGGRRRGKKITSLYGRCCIALAPRTITSNQSIPKLLLLLLASFILHVISFIYSPPYSCNWFHRHQATGAFRTVIVRSERIYGWLTTTVGTRKI